MSRFEADEPSCTEQQNAVSHVIRPRAKNLGGFSVKRVLPANPVRKVGPFVFFDEMGPADFPPGEGIQVRPHPHIGLATVTFLFEGEILHRDSLGYVQPIQPGAVNLMTAGKGIVHSERTSEERLATGQRLHGIQVWMALPEHLQETDPAFQHYPADALPRFRSAAGVETTVIIGTLEGHRSPVTVLADTLYLFQSLDAGATSEVPATAAERGIYVVTGSADVDGCEAGAGDMAVLIPGQPLTVTATEPCRIMVIGGEALAPRHLSWNFVHTSGERIRQAEDDWKAGRFDSVPGDDEYIPLPE